MKKYQKKQQKIQRSGHKRLMQEKRIVRLMHDKVLLNNFNLDNENVLMHDAIVNGVKNEKGEIAELSYDNLDTTSKRVYAFCKKYIMCNDILKLEEMENERFSIKEEMNNTKDEYTHDRLRKKYKEMGDKCNEFRKKLNENDESRKLFKQCIDIMNVHNYC